MRITLALLLAVAFAPTLAVAQPRPAPASHPIDTAKMVTDDCARARKAGKDCVLDVAAEDVDGSTPTAGDINIRVVIPPRNGSLIHLRHDFIPEIVHSAEDL